jgi:hypothetical protein
MLTSDIENEQHRRVLLQRLEKFNTDIWVLAEEKPQHTDTDYLRSSEYLAEGAQPFTEGAHLFTELAILFKERTIQNTDLYTAMSRLTKVEFDRTYASLQRDSSRKTRYEPVQDHKDHGNCLERESGDSAQSSHDQFLALSDRLDEINEKLGQSLPPQDTTNTSKTTDSATEKPPQSFWKRIWKY